MTYTLEELREKSVVNIKDGVNFGCVDDLVIDITNAKVVSIIIYGKKKFFGLLGRDPDTIIDWNDVTTIGSDVVLVNVEIAQSSYSNSGNKKNFVKMLFK